jgi:hypothetical protein
MSGRTEAPLKAEFDTVAGWTAQVVSRLGAEYAIPAACRGSANPAWLSWIADRLRIASSTPALDSAALPPGFRASTCPGYGLSSPSR